MRLVLILFYLITFTSISYTQELCPSNIIIIYNCVVKSSSGQLILENKSQSDTIAFTGDVGKVDFKINIPLKEQIKKIENRILELVIFDEIGDEKKYIMN